MEDILADEEDEEEDTNEKEDDKGATGGKTRKTKEKAKKRSHVDLEEDDVVKKYGLEEYDEDTSG